MLIPNDEAPPSRRRLSMVIVCVCVVVVVAATMYKELSRIRVFFLNDEWLFFSRRHVTYRLKLKIQLSLAPKHYLCKIHVDATRYSRAR